MAIAYNSSAENTLTASTSHSVAYSCSSGTNRFLVVGVAALGSTSDVCTGVTYNGVAMTSAGSVAQGTNRIYLWYLVNPASGSNNIVASFSSSLPAHIEAVDFTGATQTSPVEDTDTQSDTTGTVSGLDSAALTTSAGSWIVGYFNSNGDRAATTVGTTRQVNNEATNNTTTAIGTKGPLSAGTDTIRGDNNTANTAVALVSLSIKPATVFIPKVSIF